MESNLLFFINVSFNTFPSVVYIYNLPYPHHQGGTTSLWVRLMCVCNSTILGSRKCKDHTNDGGGGRY